MHRFLTARRWSMATVALSLLAGGMPASGQEPRPSAQPPAGPKMDRTGSIIVPVGDTVRIQMRGKQPITTFEADKPSVVEAIADQRDPTRIILLGQSIGTARITLKSGAVEESYNIVVQADIEGLRQLIKQAAPTSNVEVTPFGKGRVILSGNVAKIADINTIVELASATFSTGNGNAAGTTGSIINAMTVGGVQQVQLDVTVASVSRTKARQRGFSFVVGGSSFSTGSLLAPLITTTASAGTAAGGVAILPGSIATAAVSNTSTGGNLPFGIVGSQFQGVLRALKTEGIAKFLAETKLSTQSGRQAELLAGGQQPTLGPSSGLGGQSVVYQPVGTSLKFTPLVYGNGKIYLEVSPSIKGVDNGRGLNVGGVLTPFLTENSLTASVVLEPGQTFALGGLLQTEKSANTARVPVLGEIPFLGAFFSTGDDSVLETELIILVTPHLVDAMDCSQVPNRLPGMETRAPDDFEFFLETMIEAPRGQRNVFENGRYKAGWKNDPTAGTYPCGTGDGTAACATGTCAPAAVRTAGLKTAAPAMAAAPAGATAPAGTAAPAVQPGFATVAPAQPPVSVRTVPASPTSLPRATSDAGYEIQRGLPQEPASMPSSAIPPADARPSLPPLPTPR